MQNAKLMEPYELTPVATTITPPWGDIPNALSSRRYVGMTPGLHPGFSRGGKKGITLIELLVAISLLTLILFAGSGIYLSGWNMFREAQFIAQAQRNAMIPMAHMIKNLQRSIRFVSGNPIQLYFTEYTDISATPPTIAVRLYVFSMGKLRYDTDATTPGGTIVIGDHIQSFSYTISHNTPTNGVVANITITATDNNNNNPTSLTSIVEARYGASPPV